MELLKTIYIIIPVHNRFEITKNGLKVLYRSLTKYNLYVNKQRVEFSIIVVDDGSIDSTYEWIIEHYKDIIVLKGDGNLWWSGSVNLAINYLIDNNIKHDYVLLWNDDIEPDINYFINLVKILNTGYVSGIISSKVYWIDNKDVLFNAGCLFDPYTGKKTIIGLNQLDQETFNHVREIDWCGGMGVLIPKEIFKKIGLFDAKNFPQYHGDSDFMLRAKKNNYNIIMHPKLKVYNNKYTTGYKNNNLYEAICSLYSKRSNYNIIYDIKFYRRHAINNKAYIVLINKYINYIIKSIIKTLYNK